MEFHGFGENGENGVIIFNMLSVVAF